MVKDQRHFLGFGLSILAVAFLTVPAWGQATNRYSQDNVWVRVIRHANGGRTVTSHDNNSQTQEMKTYNADDQLVLRRVYQLNRYDQVQSFIIYDGGDRAVYRGEFEYDQLDRLRSETLYALPSGEKVRTLTYNPNDPKADPRVQIYGEGIPREILEQMNPEVASQGRPEAEQEKAEKPKKRGFLGGLFKRKKNKDK